MYKLYKILRVMRTTDKKTKKKKIYINKNRKLPQINSPKI